MFLKATNKYVAYGGARGGGKSYVVRMKAIMLSLDCPGIKILFLRKSYWELQKNHIDELKKSTIVSNKKTELVKIKILKKDTDDTKFNNLIDGLTDVLEGTLVEITLDKDYWGIGSGYYKNAFTVDNMTENSILVPLYTEGNVAALGNSSITGTYYENRGDKPSTDFTFLARLFN